MLLRSEAFKQKALQCGVDAVGIAAVKEVNETVRSRFRRYLSQARHAQMTYLERHLEARFDPNLLLPNAKSIIAVLCSYAQSQDTPRHPHISLYAQGRDYHLYVKEKLFAMAENLPPKSFRCFCDTAPVLEKYWAEQAGLGFIGRHSLLIHPRLGSYCFIGIILSTAEFDTYDSPLATEASFSPPCEHCRLCQKACPMGALDEDGLNAAKCLSYLTIEHKGERPALPEGCWFGCDRCQEVCPMNGEAERPSHADFRASAQVLALTKERILSMSPQQFEENFKDSPLARTGLDGLKKNILASSI